MTTPDFKPALMDEDASARILNTMETIMEMCRVSCVHPGESLNALVMCTAMHINATDYTKEEFIARVAAQLALVIKPNDEPDTTDTPAGMH